MSYCNHRTELLNTASQPKGTLKIIAILIICYIQIFINRRIKNNKECFFFLISEFLAAFPTNNLDERADSAKND